MRPGWGPERPGARPWPLARNLHPAHGRSGNPACGTQPRRVASPNTGRPMTIIPVILCGGASTQLWPLSRSNRPAQFVPLIDGRSLLQVTLSRLAWCGASVICVADEDHRFHVQEALRKERLHGQIVLGPDGAMPAVAMALAALQVRTLEGGDPLLLFSPANHHVPDSVAFREAVLEGVGAALSAHAESILLTCANAMVGVACETPAGDARIRFVRPHPVDLRCCLQEAGERDFMARYARVVEQPFAGPWTQVDGWNDVAALLPADTGGNHIASPAHTVRASRNLIHTHGRTVVALGTQDLLIVDTRDALLVARRDQLQAMDAVLAQLRRQQASLTARPSQAVAQWGQLSSVDQGERLEINPPRVKPGGCLGLRLHHHRSEHWIVLRGTAEITHGEQSQLLYENQSTQIAVGQAYQVCNPGSIELEMIEVQTGSFIGDQDVIHLESAAG